MLYRHMTCWRHSIVGIWGGVYLDWPTSLLNIYKTPWKRERNNETWGESSRDMFQKEDHNLLLFLTGRNGHEAKIRRARTQRPRSNSGVLYGQPESRMGCKAGLEVGRYRVPALVLSMPSLLICCLHSAIYSSFSASIGKCVADWCGHVNYVTHGDLLTIRPIT